MSNPSYMLTVEYKDGRDSTYLPFAFAESAVWQFNQMAEAMRKGIAVNAKRLTLSTVEGPQMDHSA